MATDGTTPDLFPIELEQSMSLFPDAPVPATSYYDREGNVINLAKWTRLRELPTYCMVRQFDNGAFRCELRWIGLSSCRFVVLYGESARFENQRDVVVCADKIQAVNQYESLLVENTACEWVKGEDFWHLMEVGNLRLPKGTVLQGDDEVALALPEGLEASAEFATW